MAVTRRVLLVVAGLTAILGVRAYIPALATNDTTVAIADGLNVTDTSKLYLQWYQGIYSQNVSYQLVKSQSTGVSKGALVHFSEEVTHNSSTTTPWIALVSCDANATNASQEDDIFTLAFDRGAVGALLYSEWSQACIINAEYADPTNFNQLMDIFSTQSLSSARLIISNFEAVNTSVYGTYNAATLNGSQADINSTLEVGYPTQPGYLWATLDAYNATENANITVAPGVAPSTPPPSGGKKTTLAMVILYAITGCVAGLFAVLIITGAIRAIRHPERYTATNGGSAGFGGQGRGAVLTRAILETFPLVKFGNRPAPDSEQATEKGVEVGTPAMEMKSMEEGRERGEQAHTLPELTSAEHDEASPNHEAVNVPSGSRSPIPRERVAGSGAPADDPIPDAIGRETCPICIVDFEEGDDVRVLPCEGKHVFHQACVDPWLLELSSSCPICRHDFQALETLLSGETTQDEHEGHRRDTTASSGGRLSTAARFSRYLRFARRRQRHPMYGPDPTDPPMPPAPGMQHVA
ncbi:hypothetical protein FA95DRAFT_1522078 [Auriscalpium vulgare]|uniref:Uncharacterized protein n=1 Tax=Auriscalpium vulgare TaxID=40419 RepID=A0ACB8RME6_9AGAM|nr:hypothetical protein FA95DRAFT_1522078 [Auriscalpium vulgare]